MSEKVKKFFIVLLKIVLWFALFCLILLLTNYSEEKVSLTLVIAGYIFILVNFYTIKNNYKNWQESESEFNKRFCEQWRPNILGYLFVFVVGLLYLNSFEFIIAIVFAYCMELWDRRFITNDIKQDMILEKLKN